MCLDLGRLKGKKKNWRVTFFHYLVWEKSKEKKIERKNGGKTWVVIKKKNSFQIWEENEEKIYS